MLIFVLALLAQEGGSTPGVHPPEGAVYHKATEFGLPEATTFEIDDRGRIGECILPDGVVRSAELDARCKTARRAMARRRIPAPIDKQGWIEGVPLREKLGPGSIRFRLIAGPDGKARTCSVLVSSGKDTVDRAICGLLIKRARLVPPADDDGNYVEAAYTNTLVW